MSEGPGAEPGIRAETESGIPLEPFYMDQPESTNQAEVTAELPQTD